jgi:hypothetical protein
LKVTLTPYELRMAATVGVNRRIDSIAKGVKDQIPLESIPRWEIDVEGACAEVAVAKALGLFWDGSVGTFRRPDLHGRIQVRLCRNRRYPSLVVRPKDNDSDIFVLVLGSAPNYEIVGMIEGGRAKRGQWLKSVSGREPAYFVPGEDLTWESLKGGERGDLRTILDGQHSGNVVVVQAQNS